MKLTTPEQIEAYCDDLAKAGTEHAHQRAFFAWLNIEQFQGRHPMARMAFAIPNGGKRDAITASRLKAEGVKPGVADICYPIPLNGKHGLWIEMKKPKVGRVADNQSEWAITMGVCGHATTICYSWRAARQAFTDYATLAPVSTEYR